MLNLNDSQIYYTEAARWKESGEQKAFLISDKRTHVSVPLLPLVVASPVVRRAAEGHCYCQEVCISVPDFSHQTLELFSDFVSGKEITGTFEDMTCLKELCCVLGINHRILSTSVVPQASVRTNDDVFVPVPMNEYCLQDMVKEEDCSSQGSFELELSSDHHDMLEESGMAAASTGIFDGISTEGGINTWRYVSVASSSAENSHKCSEQDTLEMDTDDDRNCSDEQKEKEATSRVLSEKSMKLYEQQFLCFNNWRNKKEVRGAVTEDLLLTYFTEKAGMYKSSSLWSLYSMLKATLKIRENVDIGHFRKLLGFLKQQSVGYKAKKAKTLSRDEFNKFMLTAPDDEYLFMKVALIIGIAGACRREELCKLTIDDVVDKDSLLVITIPNTSTRKRRVVAVVRDKDDVVDPLALCRKYLALRPTVAHRRLFLSYRNGKCTVQPVGINSFGKIPQKIAEFLGLENPKSYTGHCYRRSSAKLLTNK